MPRDSRSECLLDCGVSVVVSAVAFARYALRIAYCIRCWRWPACGWSCVLRFAFVFAVRGRWCVVLRRVWYVQRRGLW